MGVLIEDYMEGTKPAGFPKVGLGWGYQLLPYLEEGALHGIVSSQQMRDVAVPIYICPSRRGIVRVSNVLNVSVVLTDYASTHPCTKYKSTDAYPVDISKWPTWDWLAVYQLAYTGDQSTNNTPSTRPDPVSHDVGQAPKNDGVYDGVIVRSPWVWLGKNPFSGTVDGLFAKAPSPTRIAKITDGTSKTIMISEKYVRQDTYQYGSHSDDAGWTDGWDPDVMRCTCVPPLNDRNSIEKLTGIVGEQDTPYYIFNLGSAHPGGFNGVFADGSVRSINYDIDLYILNALGTRNGTAGGPGGVATPETISTEGAN